VDATDDFVERVAGAVARQFQEQHDAAVSSLAFLEWMTTKQAGGYLKLTPKALEHLRARGIGPRFHRLSGRVRYRLTDLRAWAAQQVEGAS
jgi:hypothetical protein